MYKFKNLFIDVENSTVNFEPEKAVYAYASRKDIGWIYYGGTNNTERVKRAAININATGNAAYMRGAGLSSENISVFEQVTKIKIFSEPACVQGFWIYSLPADTTILIYGVII